MYVQNTVDAGARIVLASRLVGFRMRPGAVANRRAVIGGSGGLLALATGIVALGGCASIPADLGRGEVNALVAARGQPVDDVTSGEVLTELVESLTAIPLEPETAVRLALVNNPQLTSTYAGLGFGAADLYEAARIRNPVFGGAWLDSDVDGERRQVTLGVAVSFTDLITLPARKRLGSGAYAALKQSIGAQVLLAAAAAERAYYEYLGAQQIAAVRAQTARAATLSAELAQRFFDAGNLTPRALALERAAASEARLTALTLEQAAFQARAKMAQVLGLSVAGDWEVRTQLPLPVTEEDDLPALLALAKQSRLDLAAASTRADVLADRLGVVNWTRWLGDLDVGIEQERETDGARLRGPTVNWQLPIFDQHRDAVLRANADLQMAVADVRRIAIDLDNGVRLAHAFLENARRRVEEYSGTLIPQRVEAVARAQEEVNFMLIGVFELISIKQQEYDAYHGYLEAIRDYWLARVDLSAAVGNSLPSDSGIGSQRLDVKDLIRPQSEGMDHSMHDHSSMKNEGASQSESMDHSMQDPSNITNDDASQSKQMDHSRHRMNNPGDSPSEAGKTHGNMNSRPAGDSPDADAGHDHGAPQ